MNRIAMKAKTNEDGNIVLDIPVGIKAAEFDVTVLIEPVANGIPPADQWPDGFFEETAGASHDDPIQRWADQGYEVRDELK